MRMESAIVLCENFLFFLSFYLLKKWILFAVDDFVGFKTIIGQQVRLPQRAGCAVGLHDGGGQSCVGSQCTGVLEKFFNGFPGSGFVEADTFSNVSLFKEKNVSYLAIYNQENAFIRRMAVNQRANYGVFIGGSAGKDGNFSWVDGSPMDYENYKPGKFNLSFTYFLLYIGLLFVYILSDPT